MSELVTLIYFIKLQSNFVTTFSNNLPGNLKFSVTFANIRIQFSQRVVILISLQHHILHKLDRLVQRRELMLDAQQFVIDRGWVLMQNACGMV